MTTLNIPVEVTSPPTGILVQADVATAQPGQTVQLLVRDTDTLNERVQEYGEVPLYWRQTRFSVVGVARLSTWQPL